MVIPLSETLCPVWLKELCSCKGNSQCLPKRLSHVQQLIWERVYEFLYIRYKITIAFKNISQVK